MTRKEVLELFERLDPDRKILLREIVFSGSETAPNEARVLLEIERYFPQKDGDGPYDPATAPIPY